MRWGLSKHQHSGRLLAHRHTSYPAVVLLLLLCGILLTGLNLDSRAISVGAVVPYPAPTSAPTIDSPTSGAQVSASPVQVAGQCQDQLIVEMFNNSNFAGSVVCQSHSYAMDVDLSVGSNQLVARQSTPDNQTSPSSNVVSVSYLPPASPTPQPAASSHPAPTAAAPASPITSANPIQFIKKQPGQQLFLVGTDTGTVFLPITFAGGDAPYAINIDWGDGTSDTRTVAIAGKIPFTHVYRHGGHFKVQVHIADSNGRVAYLTLAAMVNLAPAQPEQDITGRLSIAWPVYCVMGMMLLSFWLGERQEDIELKNKGQLV